MMHTVTAVAEDQFVDRFGAMTPAAILYLAQEAAGDHCRLLGTDYETLAKKGLFWAVSRHSVEAVRLPHRGERLTVRTWPMPATRVAYPRATEICDEAGNVLVKAVSLWVLMDVEKRSMVLPGKSGVEVPGVTTGKELELPRSLMPRPRENRTDRQVTFSLLDRNGHMNNTHYLTWVTDLLGSEFHGAHPMKSFTVGYLSEAREGQQVALNWTLSREDNTLCVDAFRGDVDTTGERVFSAQVCFE